MTSWMSDWEPKNHSQAHSPSHWWSPEGHRGHLRVTEVRSGQVTSGQVRPVRDVMIYFGIPITWQRPDIWIKNGLVKCQQNSEVECELSLLIALMSQNLIIGRCSKSHFDGQIIHIRRLWKRWQSELNLLHSVYRYSTSLLSVQGAASWDKQRLAIGCETPHLLHSWAPTLPLPSPQCRDHTPVNPAPPPSTPPPVPQSIDIAPYVGQVGGGEKA